jgi:methionyl-tRNA formyltransferase
MTNPTLQCNVVQELISAGLRPEAVVTDSPFYVKKTNFVKFWLKKFILVLRYLKNKHEIKNKFLPFFSAKKYSIPVYISDNVNTKNFEMQFKSMNIDYIFTFGFRILKENIINTPRSGCINFHPAYLPFNRGATPSKWVILNDQNKTGITFHYINKGIDKGDIIEQYEIPLSGYESAEILNNYLFSLGSILLVKLIYKIKCGAKITTINNPTDIGSYEPPFKKKNSFISKENNYKEICNIIMSSRDGYRNAFYNFNARDLIVLNFIDITNISTDNEYPFKDSNNNIFIKTSDNKAIMLITKKD